MDARNAESALLSRCVEIARDTAPPAHDQREANVFRLAAMVVQSRYPDASRNLMQASEAYFATHPDEKLPPPDVLRNGWILSLPRLRDLLSHRLVAER